VLNRTVTNRDGFSDDLRVPYIEPVDASTLTPDQVLITGPDGSPDDVLAVLPVAGSHFTQFDFPLVSAGSDTHRGHWLSGRDIVAAGNLGDVH
jgi:hypothetical protein